MKTRRQLLRHTGKWIQSNLVNTDTEGVAESVRINVVSVY